MPGFQATQRPLTSCRCRVENAKPDLSLGPTCSSCIKERIVGCCCCWGLSGSNLNLTRKLAGIFVSSPPAFKKALTALRRLLALLSRLSIGSAETLYCRSGLLGSSLEIHREISSHEAPPAKLLPGLNVFFHTAPKGQHPNPPASAPGSPKSERVTPLTRLASPQQQNLPSTNFIQNPRDSSGGQCRFSVPSRNLLCVATFRVPGCSPASIADNTYHHTISQHLHPGAFIAHCNRQLNTKLHHMTFPGSSRLVLVELTHSDRVPLRSLSVSHSLSHSLACLLAGGMGGKPPWPVGTWHASVVLRGPFRDSLPLSLSLSPSRLPVAGSLHLVSDRTDDYARRSHSVCGSYVIMFLLLHAGCVVVGHSSPPPEGCTTGQVSNPFAAPTSL